MYYFYLDSILLPVTPGKLTIRINNRNTTLDLVSGGQINIPKQPGLTEISFDAFLPVSQYPFARYDNGFKSADHYLQAIEKLKTGCAPFDFVVIRTITPQMLLQYAARLRTLPDGILREYDLNGDGRDPHRGGLFLCL